MDRSFIARLGPRQSMLVQMVVMFIVIGSLMEIGEASQRADSLVTWCRNFVLAGSARSGALAVTVSTVIGLALLAVTARLLLFAIREASAAARFARAIRRNAVPLTDHLGLALATVHVAAPVTLVRDDEPFAVTVGLLSPAIVVSTALADRLTANELGAVLLHEDAHARELHPLRALAWETLRRMFFFLPVLGDVADHFALVRELDADKHAVAKQGSRALASAILKTLSGTLPVMPIAFAPFGHLQSRIAALQGKSGTEFRLSVRRSVGTVAASALILITNFMLGSAATAYEGGKCEAVTADVTKYAFTPDFSLVVPKMSKVPWGNNRSAEVPVQSSSVRP